MTSVGGLKREDKVDKNGYAGKELLQYYEVCVISFHTSVLHGFCSHFLEGAAENSLHMNGTILETAHLKSGRE